MPKRMRVLLRVFVDHAMQVNPGGFNYYWPSLAAAQRAIKDYCPEGSKLTSRIWPKEFPAPGTWQPSSDWRTIVKDEEIVAILWRVTTIEDDAFMRREG